MGTSKQGKFKKKKSAPSVKRSKNTSAKGGLQQEIPLASGDIRPDLGKKKKKVKVTKLNLDGESKEFLKSRDRGQKKTGGKKPKKENKDVANKATEKHTALLPANKKRRLKKERQMAKPHFELVAELNKLWNQLREHEITENQKRDLMKQLMGLIKGRMFSIAMKHDSSRSVQAAIQFGNKYQRKAILDELSGHISELSQGTYSHFIVLKMFKYCIKDHESRASLCKAFKGNVTKLATHAVGSKVLELGLRTFPSKMAGNLRLEMYGQEFSLFTDSDDIPKHLKQIIEKWPDRKEKVMSNVAKLIGRMHDKGIFVQSFSHSFVWEYLQEASKKEIEELIPSLIDATMQFMSTRYGSKVIAICIGHGSPKDKKKIMKAMKGYVNSILLHRDAYLVLMQILNAIDDTVNVQKMILNEILNPPEQPQELDQSQLNSNKTILGLDGEEVEPAHTPEVGSFLLQAVLGKNSAKVFLLLLAPPNQNSKYYSPDELELLKTTPSSKKDPEIRQRELLAYLKEPLVHLACNHTPKMMRSIFASSVLLEIYKLWKDMNIQNSILAAIFDDGEEKRMGLKENPEAEKELKMYEDPAGHLFLKHLLLWEANMEKADSDPAQATFSLALFQTLESKPNEVEEWIKTNRGSFVLEMLGKVSATASKVKVLLQPVQHILENYSRTSKGATALLKISGA